ncbi:MAG: 16S rRNA (cytosine(967)-C(5))-methyltransferase RsmB [Roseburia sp.]
MTDSGNTRELILGILMEVTKEGRYSHLVLRAVLDKHRYLDKRERAFITRVAEGTIQRLLELDYIIDLFAKTKGNKRKPMIQNILRMSVYQMKYMDSVPNAAACNEAVKLARRHGFSSLAGFVNGVLRNIARSLSDIEYPNEKEHPIEALSVRYSMPAWIVRQWMTDYGTEQTKEMLEASLTEAPITIRTNLNKITPEKLKERLQAEGVCVETIDKGTAPKLSYAFAISGFDALDALASFREGLFYVQDISSMLVAEYAAPKKGDYCIDVCAAPGGKAVHLAEKLMGTGMVEARDLTEYKIGLIEQNIARHRLENLRAVQMDATIPDAASNEKADLVLADLPCSGLGVLRKKTDIKYKVTKESQKELVKLQRTILDTVCNYVKEGGTLLYSTCTISRCENEENAAWFLETHPEFAMVASRQLFPQAAFWDGFYIAKFVRGRKEEACSQKQISNP